VPYISFDTEKLISSIEIGHKKQKIETKTNRYQIKTSSKFVSSQVQVAETHDLVKICLRQALVSFISPVAIHHSISIRKNQFERGFLRKNFLYAQKMNV
jgi:hypothetical protein